MIRKENQGDKKRMMEEIRSSRTYKNKVETSRRDGAVWGEDPGLELIETQIMYV